MRLMIAAVLMYAATSVNGFLIAPISSRASATRFMSEPSDTSFDSYDSSILVESESYTPTEADSFVSSVLDSLPSFGEVSKATRTAINEALLKLEATNPTQDPTMSPLLNGVWEMRYAAGYTSDWALASPTR
jgi:PAP_fibrillin